VSISIKVYVFGTLAFRAIDWFINESILRGSEEFWVVLQNFTGPLSRNNKYILGFLSSSPFD